MDSWGFQPCRKRQRPDEEPLPLLLILIQLGKALAPLKEDQTIFFKLHLHEEDFVFSFSAHFCMKDIFVDSRLKQILLYPTFLNPFEWGLGKDYVFVFNSLRN